ncbi:DUF1771-domain-containing protein [Aureobasidium subglaciale]|nr:DUF1771-domain-containing protein [Aureobasidium subglaciale]KAI5218039.1 DUF1771-domain-containing protein [Aureobasidium subglaciale]KAI5221674.1 DUF1771-domain-containing protein [Aureobasidium subglaciale]KAI5259091.1 DUF1771-domain-containing protein [Aureobasidium subglaciale]
MSYPSSTRIGGSAFNHQQSGDSEAEYDRLRDLARKEHGKRQHASAESQKAYARGDGGAAHDLSQEAKTHGQKADDYNRQASEYIFRENNAVGRVDGDTIDLHGQFVEEAEEILEQRINVSNVECSIVGKGNHSVNHVQKIKPRVEQICQEQGLQYHTEQNEGRIYINLTGGAAVPPAGYGQPQQYDQSHHGKPQYQTAYPLSNQGQHSQQGYPSQQQGYQQNHQQQQQGTQQMDYEEEIKKNLPKVIRFLKKNCSAMVMGDSEIPRRPHTLSDRGHRRIGQETTFSANVARPDAASHQGPVRTQQSPHRTSIGGSINSSEYSGVSRHVERATISLSRSIETTSAPEKTTRVTKVYRGLSRIATKSSTNLADLSSATKEKFKDFKLTKSKSTFNLPGLLPSSAPDGNTPPLPPLPSNIAPPSDRRVVSASPAESASAIPTSVEPPAPKSPSRWTKARRSLGKRVSMWPEAVSLDKPRQGPSRPPGRLVTNALGSPVAPRKRSSLSHTLSSPHITEPVVSTTSSYTQYSLLYTLTMAASSHPDEAGHNFKPIIIDASGTPRSPHTFEPLGRANSPSQKSPYNFKPVTVAESLWPRSPRDLTRMLNDDVPSHKAARDHMSAVVASSPSITSPQDFGRNMWSGSPARTGRPLTRLASLPAVVPSSPSGRRHEALLIGPERIFSTGSPAQTGRTLTRIASWPAVTGPERAGGVPERSMTKAEWVAALNPYAKPFDPRSGPIDQRTVPPTVEVAMPNGLNGDNPFPRPYGGGWRNDPYHLYDRVPPSVLLIDPYAPSDLSKQPKKKKSSRNYYGGRSAAQRESTRYVHSMISGATQEVYEMTEFSTPDFATPTVPADTDTRRIVGTAVTSLQSVRKDLKVRNVKARDPGGNTYLYEQSYVPRFTKHSLRPSKRTVSVRNFFSRRLYGRPGDGSNLLMPHVPYPPEIVIPGVDDVKSPEKIKSGKKSKEHLSDEGEDKDDRTKRVIAHLDKQTKKAEKARKEVAKGKKKAVDKTPTKADPNYNHESAGLGIYMPPSSLTGLGPSIPPGFKQHAPAACDRIKQREKTERIQRADDAKKKREEDENNQRVRDWSIKLGADKKQAREEQKKVDRENRKEEQLATAKQKTAEFTPPTGLQSCGNERSEVSKEEDDDDLYSVSPPRIRTPKRYRDYQFEEAEQLVTPKSPQQMQYEADRAAGLITPKTPRTPTMPCVKEEHGDEDEDHAADLPHSIKGYL